ncbi:Phage protein [Limosilactobacillus reuteri]|uniref:Phage protein n=1 Tax=Limosilactobacillus reuteri TaxID=1598 RepID=A0A0U5JZG0_LIMRT|nr:helix-turn-helix transcriptional regulator [Limosilactobacillus reuteri]CUR42276.1 Phage protein [Limosilactobacillus reuteri]
MSENKKLPQNRIAKLRKEKNLSQAQLAKETGLTRQAISLYEIGKREPKLETWFKLSDFFDVPVSYLQGIGNSRDYEQNINSFKNDLYKSISDNLKKQLGTNNEQLTYTFASIFVERFVNIFDVAIKNVDMGTYLKDRYVSLAKKMNNYNKINGINAMVTRGIMLALEGEQDPVAEKKFNEVMKIIYSYHFSDDE